MRRQAQWFEFLSEFDCVVQYRPRNINGKLDALFKHRDLYPKEGSKDLQPLHFLFKSGQLRISAMNAT